MPIDGRRHAMLAVMGIDVYRLRQAPTSAAVLRIGLDAQARVCVEGVEGDAARRFFAWLPAALGIASERVCDGLPPADADLVIEFDAKALCGSASSRRDTWQALKPLARRLHGI
jgi:hypothetical protein